MKSRRVIIDANLLVLFIVGAASRAYIARHKKLTEFVPEDFDVLAKILSEASEVLVTPNTMTEASNLAAYIFEPAKSQIREKLSILAASSRETYVASRSAAVRREYLRLGLTDAVLIESSEPDTVLLTTDLDLYLAVLAKGHEAINFNHIREYYL